MLILDTDTGSVVFEMSYYLACLLHGNLGLYIIIVIRQNCVS